MIASMHILQKSSAQTTRTRVQFTHVAWHLDIGDTAPPAKMCVSYIPKVLIQCCTVQGATPIVTAFSLVASKQSIVSTVSKYNRWNCTDVTSATGLHRRSHWSTSMSGRVLNASQTSRNSNARSATARRLLHNFIVEKTSVFCVETRDADVYLAALARYVAKIAKRTWNAE